MRAGFIGLIGLPNAGKSSLMNAIIGEKVAIVSPLPQTTRRRVRGVLTTEQGQIVFVDSPGFVGENPKGLNQFLAKEFYDVVAGSDALLVLVAPDEDRLGMQKALVEAALHSHKPCLFVMSKSDQPQTPKSIEMVDFLRAHGVEPVSISANWSAEKIHGILIPALLPLVPSVSAPLYDPDIFTLERTRDLAAEMIREQAFLHLKQEVPYGVAVRILSFDESSPKLTKIIAEILVMKANHKKIVIGHGGQTIKAIGMGARLQIEQLLGTKVFLDLQVICREHWTKRSEILKELGYVVHEA